MKRLLGARRTFPRPPEESKMNLPSIPEEAMVAISSAVRDRHPISNLEELGIGQRMINLLQTNGIHDMNDLMHKNKDELLKMQNFGQKQLQLLFDALSKYHSLSDF
jgi:DNA-directed RNA polymerase alpha subunit